MYSDDYALRVAGEQELQKLEASIRSAAREFNKGTLSLEAYQEKVKKATERADELRRQLDGLSDDGGGAGGRGSQGGRGSLRGSQGMVEIARAAEDAQYGIAGVINNVNQLAVNLGLGGGVILGITAITILVNQLVKRWDALKDAAKGFFSEVENSSVFKDRADNLKKGLESVNKELEDLSKAEVFTADEAARYLKLKTEAAEATRKITEEEKRQAEMAAFREGKTIEEKKAEAGAKAESDELGGEVKKKLEDEVLGVVRSRSALGDRAKRFTDRMKNFDEVAKLWYKGWDGLTEFQKKERTREIRGFESQREVEKRNYAADVAKLDEINRRRAEEILTGLGKGQEKSFKALEDLGLKDNETVRKFREAASTGKSTSQRAKEQAEADEKEQVKAAREEARAAKAGARRGVDLGSNSSSSSQPGVADLLSSPATTFGSRQAQSGLPSGLGGNSAQPDLSAEILSTIQSLGAEVARQRRDLAAVYNGLNSARRRLQMTGGPLLTEY